MIVYKKLKILITRVNDDKFEQNYLLKFDELAALNFYMLKIIAEGNNITDAGIFVVQGHEFAGPGDQLPFYVCQAQYHFKVVFMKKLFEDTK